MKTYAVLPSRKSCQGPSAELVKTSNTTLLSDIKLVRMHNEFTIQYDQKPDT